jgi:hypothetical protein
MSTSSKKSKKQPVELVEIADAGLELNVSITKIVFKE